MPYPATPPKADLKLKASLKIRAKALGILFTLNTKAKIEAKIKKTAMTGTSFSLTVAIRFTPPIMTIPTMTVRTNPVIQGLTLKFISRTEEMEFDCVAFPVPIQAIIAKAANKAANHLIPRPFLI